MSTTQPRLAQLNGKGTLLVAGQMEYSLGAAIASANNLVTGSDGNVFHVNGTTQINLISGANWQAGAEILLIFNSACVVKNLQTVAGTNYPIALYGNTDYDAGAGSVLLLFFDGATWYDSRLGLTIGGTVNKVSSLPAASASNEGNFYLLNAAPAGTAYDTLVLAESSLLHYYKMNETSGTTCTDSKGSINGTNYHITVDEVSLGGDGEPCYYFNEGAGSACSLFSSAWYSSVATFTIEFLFKMYAQDTSYGNMIIGIGGGGNDPYIQINAENQFQVDFAGLINNTFTNFTPVVGTMYHCAVTWDGTHLLLYINGSLIQTITPGYSPTISGSTCWIGNANTSNAGSFWGYMAKVALYSAALSGADVLAHYNAVFPAAATPDVMYVCEQNSLNVFAMRQVCDNLNFLPDFAPTGLMGATAASRYVGATTGGAPATGTFAAGDFVIDQTGAVWVCTTAGTPGTWQASSITSATFAASTYSGLQMWLKANAITGLTNGQSLSTWSDASGNGNNAAGGTAPTYLTGQINGLPAIQFASASSQYLACTSYNPVGKFTCIFVAKFGTTGNVFSNAYVHTNDGGWTFAYNSGNILFQSGIGTATWPSGANTGGTALDTGNYQIYSVVQGYGNLNIRVHGAVANVVNVLSPTTGDSHGFLIGALYNGGYGGFWSGYLAEVLIYNRELSAAEVAGVEEYLALKYGL